MAADPADLSTRSRASGTAATLNGCADVEGRLGVHIINEWQGLHSGRSPQ